MSIRFKISVLTIIVIIVASSCKNRLSNKFIAPNGIGQGHLILHNHVCYFADADSIEKQTQIKIDAPSVRELEQITSIMEYTGLPQNFKIYRGNVDNALATIVNNKRYIIYNKDLFTTMDIMDRSYWSSMFIIAHEIGHHLANNLSYTNNTMVAELEADRFAGFILFKMGADSNEVINAVASNLISSTEDSESHPSKNKRIQTVKESWRTSYLLRCFSAIPPPIHDHFSEAVGKPFNNDATQNNLEGFPVAYHPTGYNDYQLVNNSWALSKIDSLHKHLLYDYRDSDSSIYQIFPSISRNYNGIIIDVQKKMLLPEFDDCVLLEIGILVTKIDPSYNFAGLSVNQRYQFLVSFSPRGFTQDILSYTNFFAGGRRLNFDIINLNKTEEKNGLFNISKAYSL
jgi:hypothetical protein